MPDAASNAIRATGPASTTTHDCSRISMRWQFNQRTRHADPGSSIMFSHQQLSCQFLYEPTLLIFFFFFVRFFILTRTAMINLNPVGKNYRLYTFSNLKNEKEKKKNLFIEISLKFILKELQKLGNHSKRSN